MIDEVWELKQKCGHVTNIYVDAANPEVWQSLKREFEEPYNEQYIKDKVAYAKKHDLHVEDQMFVVPVPFSIQSWPKVFDFLALGKVSYFLFLRLSFSTDASIPVI
jgi:hypothetical protein